MKRLIKTSMNISNFAQTWYNDWKLVSDSQVNEIIDKNVDCIYNGEAYRYIGLSKNKCLEGLDIFNDKNITVDNIIDNIKNQIKISDKYCSWSCSYEITKNFKESMIKIKENYEFGIFIKSNIQGLNLMKLYPKYSKTLNPDAEYFYKAFNEEEIIAKMSNDYEIIALADEYNYYEIDNIDLYVIQSIFI